MKESDGGFSFGARPSQEPSDDEESIDAIEVSGEPVSRNEAKNLGLASVESTRDRSATSLMRLEELPPGTPSEIAEKLEAAWAHLRKNEIEQALTLAQEVVFESPTLVAAKLIIARCFINRKEYDKALALLQAIPENEKNAETWYYIGLCQSRLGKIKDAIDSLKFCRAGTTDPLLRKRASDLLLHLQGEQIECPVCGKRALYDSMVEVGNQTVCANCAKNAVLDEEDDEDDDEIDPTGAKRRKRLRPPLTKSDLLLRLLFVAFILGVLTLGVYMLYLLAPGYYVVLQQYFPDWTPLPRIENMEGTAGTGPGPGERQPATFIDGPPIDSPGIERAYAGMELRDKVKVEGYETRDGIHTVTLTPSPKTSKFSINAKTGEFAWRPAEDDIGREFEVLFQIKYGNVHTKPQINSFVVGKGPAIRQMGAWTDFSPGKTTTLLGEDMDGAPGDELLIFSGEYWNGEILILKDNGESFGELARARIPGHPAAAGVIKAEEEKWVAVADYWNSRLRYFALRNGSLSEMALTLDLPGQPVMGAFNSGDSTMAFLCRTPDSMRVVAYRLEGTHTHRQLGDWRVPDEVVWRRLFILKGEAAREPVKIALLGADFSNSVLLLEEKQDAPRVERSGLSGTLVDAVLDRNGNLVHCLVDSGGKLQIAGVVPVRERGSDAPPTFVEAGSDPAFSGFCVVDFSGKDYADLVVLSGSRVGLSLGSSASKSASTQSRFGEWSKPSRDMLLTRIGETVYWPLPDPPVLFGQPTSLRNADGLATRVVYMGATGELWSVTLSE